MKNVVLGVAGIGLIGGSIALRAHAEGATVIGFDRDAEALRAARAAGALDATAGSLAELAERAEVVALALPIEATLTALRETPELARAQLVFDVASVKLAIAQAGRPLPRFVPSHPLAGREQAGFGAAGPALFEGRAWAFAEQGTPEARAQLQALVQRFGGRPVAIDPAEHDRLVAVSSHLPQILSVVLGARLAEAGADDGRAFALCGPGMASMLRLARSPVELWTSIAAANAGPLGEELRTTARALEQIAAELDSGRTAALAATFGAARHAVSLLSEVS